MNSVSALGIQHEVLLCITYKDYRPDQKREKERKDETYSLSAFLPGGQ